MSDKEREHIDRELIRYMQKPDVAGMFVTPKNIDEIITRVSYTISEAINRFLT